MHDDDGWMGGDNLIKLQRGRAAAQQQRITFLQLYYCTTYMYMYSNSYSLVT